MSRKSISKSVRFDVFKRDRFTCQYCGATPPAVLLELDHIHPVSKGGDDGFDNLVTACEPCNRGKSAKLLTDVPINLAKKAALAAEKERQIAGYEAVMRARRMRLDDEASAAASEWLRLYQVDEFLMCDFRSIRNFVDKMGYDAVLDAIYIANTKCPGDMSRAFKYLCGTCWGIIKQRDAL